MFGQPAVLAHPRFLQPIPSQLRTVDTRQFDENLASLFVADRSSVQTPPVAGSTLVGCGGTAADLLIHPLPSVAATTTIITICCGVGVEFPQLEVVVPLFISNAAAL